MGSDLVERAAPPSEVFAVVTADGRFVEYANVDEKRAAFAAYGTSTVVRYVLPTAEPERADVATLAELKRRIDAMPGSPSWSQAYAHLEAMLTEARAQPAAPSKEDPCTAQQQNENSRDGSQSCAASESAELGSRSSLTSRLTNSSQPKTSTSSSACTADSAGTSAIREPAADGEYADLLLDAEDRAACRVDADAIAMRSLAAALRKVLGEKADLERERVSDACSIREARDAAKRQTQIAEAERAGRVQAEADLACEREAHEETRRKADDCAAYHKRCADCGAMGNFIGQGLFECWKCTAEQLDQNVRASDVEREAARAEVERLKAELAGAVTAAKDEAKAEMRSRLAIILGARDGEDIEDAADRLRVQLEAMPNYARAIGEIEAAVGVAGDVPLSDTVAAVKRLRAQLEPVGKLDAESLANIYNEAFEACPSSNVSDCRQAGAVAVAQAFARAMLTDGAMRAFDAAYCEIVRHSRTEREIDAALLAGMRAAIEYAGLHVAAEPATARRDSFESFRDGRTGEILYRVAEPVADESDAEVMLAAVREQMAPEHVAAFDAARAAAAADAERTRGVLMGALDKAKRLRVDPAKAATVPRASIGLPAPAAEPVAEGRACPVTAGTLEYLREGRSEEVCDFSRDKLLAWLHDEVRRLGGGGR